MHGLTVVQERSDKHPTLAYIHHDKWHSYSNHKYLKWEPTEWTYTDSLVWMVGKPSPELSSKVFVVLTSEGINLMAHWKGDDWFSQHTGRRLLVNVRKWAPVCKSI